MVRFRDILLSPLKGMSCVVHTILKIPVVLDDAVMATVHVPFPGT